MASTLRTGLVQFDITWENRDDNIAHIDRLMAGLPQIDLLILPEMWPTGFSMRPEVIAEKPMGPALTWMAETSQRLNISMTGSIAVKDGSRYYNRLYFVNPDKEVHYYDKRHLFSFGGEDHHYASGNERKVIEFNGWKIMPVICYDLRFPVWCRNNLDYDLMIVVANWPISRIHHWDILLRARAIENQSYIAAVNRTGVDDNGLHYPGHSGMIDMNGKILLDMGGKEGIEMATLDRDQLEAHRSQFRFLQDRDEYQL